MDYFFFIYHARPNVVIFQTERARVKQKQAAVTSGRFWQERSRLRWEDSLDVASPELRFYSLDKEKQLDLLVEFVQKSYGTAQALADH